MAALKCPECGAPMTLGSSIYGKFYGCSRFPACRGSHGATPNGQPLGIPADCATKQARIRAHAAFDTWWKEFGIRRKDAYFELKRYLGIRIDDCHIAMFDAGQCERVIRFVSLWVREGDAR